MTERTAYKWDDWVKTCGKPTVWCGFDWLVMLESYVVFPQNEAITAEQCAQEAQSYITMNTGDIGLAQCVANAIRALVPNEEQETELRAEERRQLENEAMAEHFRKHPHG